MTVKTFEDCAQFLWGLLDDIDTASDRAKADNAAYREIVERIQRRRFEIGSTDGYVVKFTIEPDSATLRALPGYPWLPCPICGGTEGCDDTVAERARAAGVNFFIAPGRA